MADVAIPPNSKGVYFFTKRGGLAAHLGNIGSISITSTIRKSEDKMMKLNGIFACVSIGILLGGCAYQVPVTANPDLNVYSSYSSKLPGTYALYIAADSFSRTVKPTGIQCSVHSYPLDLQMAFKDATVRTVQQLVENVRVVERPVSSDQLAAENLQGMIVIEADTMNATVQFIPGFFSVSATSTVELSANMSVDGINGRLLGTAGDGEGNVEGDGGQFCAGGADVIADASEKAMKKLLGELGERLSNAPRLRVAGGINKQG